MFSLSSRDQLTIDLWGNNSIRKQVRSPVFMQQKLVSVTKGSDLIVLIVWI